MTVLGCSDISGVSGPGIRQSYLQDLVPGLQTMGLGGRTVGKNLFDEDSLQLLAIL